MKISRSIVLSIAGVALVFPLSACVEDDGGGGGAQAGDPCTETDYEEDRKICSGTLVLECKEDDDGKEYWVVDENCRDEDMICSGGDCVGTFVDDNNDNNDDNNDGNNDNNCIDVAGSWTITQHCRADVVGETFTVTQSDCDFVVVESGWNGTVTSSGQVTMGGPAGPGAEWTCTGTITTTRLSVDCTPEACHVEMTK